MKKRISCGVVLGLLAVPGRASTPNHPPIVVELFESQGCSSCPPAEYAVKTLQKEFGDSIVPLIFHVDYWDHPWKDTFSDPKNTARQKEYVGSFGESTLYTPEMVIQGEVGFVGSDLRRARKETRRRLDRPATAFRLTVAGPSASHRDAVARFDLPPDLNRATMKITVVVLQNAPPVAVKRGENSGVAMTGDFAVRTFWTVWPTVSGRYTIVIPGRFCNGVQPVRITVLLQGSSHKILSAATASCSVAATSRMY